MNKTKLTLILFIISLILKTNAQNDLISKVKLYSPTNKTNYGSTTYKGYWYHSSDGSYSEYIEPKTETYISSSSIQFRAKSYINEPVRVVVNVSFDTYSIQENGWDCNSLYFASKHFNKTVTFDIASNESKEISRYFDLKVKGKTTKGTCIAIFGGKTTNASINSSTLSVYVKSVTLMRDVLAKEEADKYFRIAEKYYNEAHQKYLNTDKLNLAIKYYKKTIEKFKQSGKPYKKMANCYFDLYDYDNAEKNYLISLNYKRDHYETFARLVYIYARENNFNEIYRYSKKAISIKPNEYRFYNALSISCVYNGRYEEGISAATTALDLHPGFNTAYRGLVLNYVLNNQFEKAKPIYIDWKNDWLNFTGKNSKKGKEEFLFDIKELEKAGIRHKNFAKVRELLNNKHSSKNTRNVTKGKYIFASNKAIKFNKLWKFSLYELKIMRNEILARYGHSFKSNSQIQKYFNKQEWYKNKGINAYHLITKLEKNNITKIRMAETYKRSNN